MAKQCVNALVRVSTNNELDFGEWLDYNIAIGFDHVYVYDSGNHGWLAEVCRKREERVTLVPKVNNDWRKKSNIISAYVAQAVEPTWAICLEDDEYIWMDPTVTRSISDFINQYIAKSALAMSVYVKYLSSEKPMKNRVGTLIDCFQHARPNPQGFVAPNPHTPNCTLTFFCVTNNRCVPMSGPLTPNTPHWRDSRGTLLNATMLGNYLSSKQYNPDGYPIRGYKYKLKSGIEMALQPGTKPVGYVVRDNNMIKARESFLQIPANEETEALFAKDEVMVEQPKLPKRELSADEMAELELPIPPGKIDTFILYGYPLEHVIDFAVKNGYEDTVEHRAVIERVYRRECSMIIESSPIYRRLAELDSEGGHSDDVVCQELKISYPALLKMRKCMSVLDIAKHDAEKAAVENVSKEADNQQAKAIVEASDMAELTKSFDDSVNSQPISAEDVARFDAEVDGRRAKRRDQAKKARAKKKAKKDAESKTPSISNADVTSGTATAEIPVKDEATADTVNIDIDDSNLLNNTDLSTFGVVDA